VTGSVRIVEYEVVHWSDLDEMGNLPTLLADAITTTSSVGIVRCVTHDGRKVTFAGDAKATKELITSGAASRPSGTAIAKKDFPVMLEGWPHWLRHRLRR
jgi:hypothetical protein